MEMKPGLMLWKDFRKMTVGFMGFISFFPRVTRERCWDTQLGSCDMQGPLAACPRGPKSERSVSSTETNDILQHRCFKKNNKLKALRRAQLQGQDPLSESILGLKAPQLFVG